MKKTILSLLAGALFAYNAQAQATFDRAYAVGGSSTESVYATAVDAAGNLYITGYFQGTATFDEAGTSSLTSAGSNDAFIAKYAPSGALTWAKRIGGTGNEVGRKLALDGSGNVYIGGNFEGTVDFDPNAGTQNLASAGSADAFLLKLDSNGDFVSVKQFGSTGYDSFMGVVADGSNNLYLAIYFEGSIDSDPNAGTQTLTNSGLGSALVKLDAAQNFVWSHAMETSDGSLNIATNAAGDLYFSQQHYSLPALDLDRSAATQAPLALSTYNDGFWIAKWNTAGTFQWTKTISGKSTYDYALDVLNDGNIAIVGAFRDSIDLDPSAAMVLKTNAFSAIADIAFVLQLNSAGDFVSGQVLEPQNANSSNYIFGIGHDADDNMYIGGRYGGAIDFDPSAGAAVGTGAVTKYLPFVLKLNSAGGYLWHYASVDTTLGACTAGYAINSANAAHVYLVGGQIDALAFDTDTTAVLGGQDIFVAKWSQTVISVERTEFAQMQLFPNPSFDGSVNVQLGEFSAGIEATVFNGLGQQMSSTQYQNVDRLQVELPSAAGMYFIELRSQDGKRATLKAQRQ